MSNELHVQFYHRHAKRLKDDNVFTLVAVGVASHGLTVDRFKDIEATRLNKSVWHYVVPVMQVAS